mgnify:CR=1 FL=1
MGGKKGADKKSESSSGGESKKESKGGTSGKVRHILSEQNGKIMEALEKIKAGAKFDEVITINVARLLAKDGIQKGTFELELGVSGSDAGYAAPFTQRIKIKDLNGTSSYKVNSPKGEYGILYANNSTGTPLDGVGIDATDKTAPCGLIYYQAGVAVLSASMFMPSANGGIMSASTNNLLWLSSSSRQEDIHEILTSGSIEEVATGLRRRMYNMTFNNTTNLVSTMYFCDIEPEDFNFSANPTYLTGSKIRVKGNDPQSPPKAYITTVGLYNGADQLLVRVDEPGVSDLALRVRVRSEVLHGADVVQLHAARRVRRHEVAVVLGDCHARELLVDLLLFAVVDDGRLVAGVHLEDGAFLRLHVV